MPMIRIRNRLFPIVLWSGAIALILLLSMASSPTDTSGIDASEQSPDRLLQNLLRKYPDYFGKILQHPDSFRVQIIYTTIDRKADNRPVFKDHTYRLNPQEYFYPASTIKLPVALLSLQRINELKIAGLDKNSTLLTGAAYSGQTEVGNDPTTPDGRPTIAHYIKKILLVSDNDAYNRLYEFLGPDYINSHLHKMGYPSAAIIHRLERSLSEDENRHTNPVQFLNPQGKVLYQQPLAHSSAPAVPRNDFLGSAYYKGGELIQGPMNFSLKNRLVLADLHSLLKSVLFPYEVPAEKRFGLTPQDYAFVRQYLSQYPSETHYPEYDSAAYWDAYCKFIYWGSEKRTLPKTFRIFNKVGDAYGFLIDAAYVVDFEQKIEFLVSAMIYCNSDGILNDSNYDYDAVGFPFLKNLGQVLYQYERTRKRPRVPQLSSFQLKYDK